MKVQGSSTRGHAIIIYYTIHSTNSLHFQFINLFAANMNCTIFPPPPPHLAPPSPPPSSQLLLVFVFHPNSNTLRLEKKRKKVKQRKSISKAPFCTRSSVYFLLLFWLFHLAKLVNSIKLLWSLDFFLLQAGFGLPSDYEPEITKWKYENVKPWSIKIKNKNKVFVYLFFHFSIHQWYSDTKKLNIICCHTPKIQSKA